MGRDRVTINPNYELDMQILQDRQKFYGQGKRCAPPGIIQLPGGIARSHSDVILAGPKTMFEASQAQKEADRAGRPDKLRAEAQGNASICPRVPSLAEPSFPPPEYGYQHWLTEKPANCQTAGGKMQGVQLASYDSFSGDQYDPSKHGWAHPEARRKQEELRGNVGCRSQCTFQEPSFRWSIEKARDHVGYHNASMARGNIQGTAMSMNVPDWFAGVRMVPGPQGYGHKFPAVDCEDGKLLLNTRVWEKGPNLSVIEKRRRPYSAPSHSAPAASRPGKKERPGTAPSKGRPSKTKASTKENRPSSAPSVREKPEKPEYFDHWRGNYERRIQNDIRCKHGSSTCDLIPCHPSWGMRTKSALSGTGCVVKQQYAPMSDWVGIDPKVPGAG
eukprot:gnl/MRDRNA2_/MRDRNA2_94387_c0_seq1.p1 gnl/MRDRNA2_/MRDRNA2_94387_c0~~gnl/MRDRNA2_/MRDRNA2_94387_c0_seq1.p1  ORF type:complete len:388 (+),score=62.95 gnl/MRDRNA2_/MRDRNA2_94387_c0_seq1:78-1241(+)